VPPYEHYHKIKRIEVIKNSKNGTNGIKSNDFKQIFYFSLKRGPDAKQRILNPPNKY
jgi:hypothetical protein